MYHVGKFTLSARVTSDLVRPLRFIKAYTSSSPYRISSRSLRNHISVCACLFVSGYTHTHIYIYIYGHISILYIYIYTCIYVYKNQCTCPSMQGMCLCLVYHVCNTILTYCWLPSVFFFRWFAHGLVKPIGNSTKWTQSAVKRKAFEHGAKSMVTESAIRVIEIARCLFSKQTKTTGPQWTTLPCFWKTSKFHVLLKHTTCRAENKNRKIRRTYNSSCI